MRIRIPKAGAVKVKLPRIGGLSIKAPGAGFPRPGALRIPGMRLPRL